MYRPPADPVAPASTAPTLADRYGRHFAYLRLSLTEACNFRCTYCLPDGYRKPHGGEDWLSVDEITRAVRAFAALGLWKIRLTGGEPTIRPDFLEIARAVAGVSGVRRLAMTTNGYRLDQRAAEYRAAGVDAINVSVDSLDTDRFAASTGHDRLGEVLAGIDACRDAGFGAVKLNAVLMKGINEHSLGDFTHYVRERRVGVRFIELMRTNDNVAHFTQAHVSARVISDALATQGWCPRERAEGAGPAIDYTHPDYAGTVGVIAPYSADFCASCNRLRLSATGKLHLCLFGDGGHDLRPLLQHDDQFGALVAAIIALLPLKGEAHPLHDGLSGATPHLASIGG